MRKSIKNRAVIVSIISTLLNLSIINSVKAASLNRNVEETTTKISLAVCLSEGNCVMESSGNINLTNAINGHTDPGSGYNKGWCSNQKPLSVKEANIQCYEYIILAKNTLGQIMNLPRFQKPLTDLEKTIILATLIDAYVQSPLAAASLPEDLKCTIQDNPNDSILSLILKARHKGYWTRNSNPNNTCPNYIKLDASGLGNNPETVFRDSERRIKAIIQSLSINSKENVEKFINENTLNIKDLSPKVIAEISETINTIYNTQFNPNFNSNFSDIKVSSQASTNNILETSTSDNTEKLIPEEITSNNSSISSADVIVPLVVSPVIDDPSHSKPETQVVFIPSITGETNENSTIELTIPGNESPTDIQIKNLAL